MPRSRPCAGRFQDFPITTQRTDQLTRLGQRALPDSGLALTDSRRRDGSHAELPLPAKPFTVAAQRHRSRFANGCSRVTPAGEALAAA